MNLSMICAVGRSGVIGRDGSLPWRLPDELRYFRAVTSGKPVIMGRRTFESIGRPLPKRRNIVLSRQRRAIDGVIVVNSEAEALQAARAGDSEEALIIGGAALYAAFLPACGRLYLTEVDTDVAGDVYFPRFDRADWDCLARARHPRDERHDSAFEFMVLERRGQPTGMRLPPHFSEASA